jgi:hypothetical protein
MQEDYENAYLYYSKAVEHAPTYPLAQFGYGQLCIYKGTLFIILCCCGMRAVSIALFPVLLC